MVRIDSASSPGIGQGSGGKSKRIAELSARPANVAEGFGERLAAEGEICWGGMHSWKRMLELLEDGGRPETLGSRPTWRIRCSYTLGYNAPEDRILPQNYDWTDQEVLDDASAR